MDLILWRHAEAAVQRADEDDLERPLTAKGERQAQRMGEWLNQRLAHSTRVLVSPALRCQQTARGLGRHFRTVSALRPGCDAATLLAAARWPDASEPVLVVGHQPTLGFVAALLLAEAAQGWSVNNAAAWWLRHGARDDLQHVVLKGVQSPELL
jgi:phosphohistidine phosphatase